MKLERVLEKGEKLVVRVANNVVECAVSDIDIIDGKTYYTFKLSDKKYFRKEHKQVNVYAWDLKALDEKVKTN